MPFLQRLRVVQVLVEVHGCLQHSREKNLGLMRALAGRYGVFHSEPNLEHSDGSCIEFGLLHLYNSGANNPKGKQTANVHVLSEQLKRVEEKLRQETSMLEELQEYLKQRSRLEHEHAQALSKLSQQVSCATHPLTAFAIIIAIEAKNPNWPK